MRERLRPAAVPCERPRDSEAAERGSSEEAPVPVDQALAEECGAERSNAEKYTEGHLVVAQDQAGGLQRALASYRGREVAQVATAAFDQHGDEGGDSGQ